MIERHEFSTRVVEVGWGPDDNYRVVRLPQNIQVQFSKDEDVLVTIIVETEG